jgi:hypothetical protein
MLLTGTSSILTGSPGAVLLYPLLGFAVYPRKRQAADAPGATRQVGDDGLLSRKYLRYILAGFWIFGALLQLQPNWWQPGQISQTISGYIGMMLKNLREEVEGVLARHLGVKRQKKVQETLAEHLPIEQATRSVRRSRHPWRVSNRPIERNAWPAMNRSSLCANWG